MVANFNPTWRGITEALRLAVIAAGGTPSVSVYPANWGGAIRAIDDLRGAIVALDPDAALAAHVAAADPHSQYALDSALAGYVATTTLGAANGTATLDGTSKLTASQLPLGTTGTTAAAGNDARLSDARTPIAHNQTASTITDFNEAAQDAVGSTLTDSTSIDFTYNDGANTITAAAIFGTGAGTVAQGNDARLSDARTPIAHNQTASTITDFNEAAQDAVGSTLTDSTSIDFTYNDGANTITAAAIFGTGAGTVAQGNDTRIVNSDAHRTATTNVHGLPASVAPLGNRNAAGEFIQHGAATVTGASLAISFTNYRTQTVTFPVAFATTPRVVVGGSNTGFPVTATGASTTDFTMLAFGDAAIPATYIGNYIALGT